MGDKTWVEGYQLVRLDEKHKNFRWASEKMAGSIGTHRAHGGKKIGGYEILEVHQVKNSTLWRKYEKRREQMSSEIGGQVTEMRLFHGTFYALEITKNGFNKDLAKESGMFGKGIYFADMSSKSNQYTLKGGFNAPCEAHEDVLCDKCERNMLICRVALGKQYNPTEARNGILKPPEGNHSIVAKPAPNFLDFAEYAIHDNYQAYPGHLIKYRIKNVIKN